MKEWKKIQIYQDKLHVVINKYQMIQLFGFDIPEDIRFKLSIKNNTITLKLGDYKKGYKLIPYQSRWYAFIPLNYFKLSGININKYKEMRVTTKGKKKIIIELR